MKQLVIGAAVCLVGPFALVGRADSIWERADPQSGYLFVNSRARQVGDVLTVLLRENTGIENRDNRDLRKDNEGGVSFGLTGDITGNSETANRQAEANLKSNSGVFRGMKGRSEYTVDQRFVDRVSVMVVAVMPNGNLIIQGHRKRLIAGEERVLQLSGIVRPQDIGFGNMVESPAVANFQVIYLGRGPESRYSNPGWLNRVVTRFWPF